MINNAENTNILIGSFICFESFLKLWYFNVNIKLRLALLYLQNTKDGHCTDFVTLILEKVWYTSKDARSIILVHCRYFRLYAQ